MYVCVCLCAFLCMLVLVSAWLGVYVSVFEHTHTHIYAYQEKSISKDIYLHTFMQCLYAHGRIFACNAASLTQPLHHPHERAAPWGTCHVNGDVLGLLQGPGHLHLFMTGPGHLHLCMAGPRTAGRRMPFACFVFVTCQNTMSSINSGYIFYIISGHL